MSDRPSEASPENDHDTIEPIETDEAVDTLARVKLEPIRTVVRELKRPDGSTVTVEVPVYPPFELKDMPSLADAKSATDEKLARGK